MRETTSANRGRLEGAVRASWTAAWRNRWFRAAVISVLAAVFMSVAGAFGTGGAPLAWRLIYWIAMMGVGSVLGVLAANLAWRWLENRPLTIFAVTSVALAVPYTVFVWGLTTLMFKSRAAYAGLSVLQGLAFTFPPVLMVSMAMGALNMLASPKLVRTHAALAGEPPPRFLERLPLKLRGAEIYAVEAEDHYLRIRTDRGSDLILMRLSDAVTELEGIEGARTHRSWWVAKAAVIDVRRSDGRALLKLKDGAEAPVSRSHARTLRQQSWF